jgi:uncharacterized protein
METEHGDTLDAKVSSFFQSRAEDVVSVYLFGSQATGRATASSDVDIGVLFSRAPERTFQGLQLGLAGDLERVLGRRVDLVVLNRAPPDLVHRVLRDGRVIVDRHRARRLEFEVKARNEYLDLLPVLQRYRRMSA